MSDARVDLSEVRIHRRRRIVLDGCTAAIGEGVTLLAGSNGSGKSTLLAAIAGLVPVSSGTIAVSGRHVRGVGLDRWHGRRVGYLPQEPRLPAQLTVGEAIDYGRWLRRSTTGMTSPQPFTTADLAARLHLTSLLHRPLGELSGGMNRLALLAVAVVHRPPVLLLDEATAGVDVEHRATLRSFLDELRPSTAIILASHVSGDFDHLADRVLVLSRGRVAFTGDVESLGRLGESDRNSSESGVEAALRSLSASTRP